MMQRIIRASSTIGFFTFLSRILGFIRDIFMAAYFGTSMIADAFFLAFTIPNILRRLFGEGTLNAALIPVYSEYIQSTERTDDFLVRNLLTIIALILCGVVMLGVAFTPSLISLFAYGWRDKPDQIHLTIILTRILFPYILFIALTLVIGAILNTHQRFITPALSPVILNLFWIGSLVFFGSGKLEPATHITFVAWGIILGGIGQFLIQLPAYKSVGLSFRPVIRFRDPHLKSIIILLIPGLFGLAVTEINMILDTFLASLLVEGSISALRLANRLMLLPLGVFGVAVATALLPVLSKQAVENNVHSVYRTCVESLQLIFFILIPISILLIAFRLPIVSIVFERGAFDSVSSTPLTAFALLCYSVGLGAYGGLKITVQAFFAFKDTKTPVKIAAYTLVVNMVLNIAGIYIFEALWPGKGLGGLALATSLSAIFNLLVLWKLLSKKSPDFALFENVGYSLKLIIISIPAGLLARYVYTYVSSNVIFSGNIAQALLLCMALLLGILLYFTLAYLLKIKELGVILSFIQKPKS